MQTVILTKLLFVLQLPSFTIQDQDCSNHTTCLDFSFSVEREIHFNAKGGDEVRAKECHSNFQIISHIFVVPNQCIQQTDFHYYFYVCI